MNKQDTRQESDLSLPESLEPKHREFYETVIALCQDIENVVEENLSPEDQIGKIRELAQTAGVWSFNHPPDLGGRDNPKLLELVVLYETLAARNLLRVNGVFGPNPGILANVGEPLRSNYLAPLLQGNKVSAFGFTEPDDAKSSTSAVLQDDYLIVNGQKSYVTGGQTADFINTLVHVQDFGPSVVVIDREAEGVSIKRVFGSSDGSRHAYMEFKDVRVPVTHVVGGLGEGMPRALDQITNVRLILAAQSAGLTQWVIDYVTEHITAPHRSGSPLSTREGVRLRYADMRIEAFAVRSTVLSHSPARRRRSKHRQ